jgi:hypothetical protein
MGWSGIVREEAHGWAEWRLTRRASIARLFYFLRGCAGLRLSPLQILAKRRGEPLLPFLVFFRHDNGMRSGIATRKRVDRETARPS